MSLSLPISPELSPAVRALVGRLVRFGAVGAVTTAFAYGLFMGFLALGAHYLVANALTWPPSLCLGFWLNRRFTFGRAGTELMGRQFALFLIGAGLQFLLGSAGYLLWIGVLHLSPSLAFVANLALSTSFSFLFLNFAAFRR